MLWVSQYRDSVKPFLKGIWLQYSSTLASYLVVTEGI